jgi:two-component system chemotaxis sensor kinase CheA
MAIDTEDDIVQDFLIESREILDALQQQLVDLEQRPDDRELLNAVFRGFHTIKGGAGFLNLEPLVAVCHLTEDLFNLLRAGEKTATPELMDVVLEALDVVQAQFIELEAEQELTPASVELLAALEALTQAGDAVAAAPPAQPAAPAAAAEEEISDQEFEALLDVMDPVSAAAAAEPGSDDITDEEFEHLLDALHGPGQHGGTPMVKVTPTPTPTPAPVPVAGGGDDLIKDDEFEDLLDSLHGAGKGPTTAPKPAALPAAVPVSAPGKVAAARSGGSSGGTAGAQTPVAAPARGETTVRVDTAKLDDIMNMVGELVLVRNRLSTLRGLLNDERLNHAVGDLELVTSDLQNAVMQTRMQPIKKVFGRFPRVVRDLARSLKKEVELELQGEETDLDKNLVEALADPLVHLVRNAVDHGIEEPASRQAAGKTRTGRVLLAAAQEGDHILLTIADDGKGMDPEVLRRKAVEKGMMDAESAARLEREDCFNLIFQPGFSTKAEISDVSGRGVGLDVVKTRIAQLNGSIEIDSKPGAGTTMKIRVPLTLAILPTLMVKIEGRKFALPMSVVREIFELDRSHTNVVDGRLTVMVRNRAMPLFFLDRWLKGLAAPARKSRKLADDIGECQVVTVVIGNLTVGFVVQEVLGLEEVVIKPLGAMLHGLPGLAGSTITGDGSIALIIDIPSLIKSFGSRL